MQEKCVTCRTLDPPENSYNLSSNKIKQSEMSVYILSEWINMKLKIEIYLKIIEAYYKVFDCLKQGIPTQIKLATIL